MGTFIVGFDGDTTEVFDQIVDFVTENRLETAFTLILTPKPDTMLFNQMNTQNRMISHDWRDYDEGTVTFIPKNMERGGVKCDCASIWPVSGPNDPAIACLMVVQTGVPGLSFKILLPLPGTNRFSSKIRHRTIKNTNLTLFTSMIVYSILKG